MTTTPRPTKLGARHQRELPPELCRPLHRERAEVHQDEFLPPTFAGVPRALQSTQDLKQFFTRGEAVWTGFDGRFTNYLRRELHRQLSATNQTTPTSIPTINAGRRTKVDWRGVALLMPGQTLVTGLEHEIESMGSDGRQGRQRQQRRLCRAAVGIRAALLRRQQHPPRRQRALRRGDDLSHCAGACCCR